MEEEEEGLRTMECLRGRLLAERQVSRSAKQEAEIISRKMEELEGYLREEIRLREKAEKRLKFLMRKLEFIKGSKSMERLEQLSSSEVSCLSSVSTSASKEEEEEEEEEDNIVMKKANVNAFSIEEVLSSKHKDVITLTTSHEEETQYGNDQTKFNNHGES